MRTRGAQAAAWLLAAGSIAAVTAIGRAMSLNPGTVGFALLIAVLLASLRGGLLVGTAASILATLCYNFFFFPPLYTFTIHEGSNWVALLAFLVTSVTVNRLALSAVLLWKGNFRIPWREFPRPRGPSLASFWRPLQGG